MRNLCAALLAILVVEVECVSAQLAPQMVPSVVTIRDAADSAAAARAEYRSAMEALASADTGKALDRLMAATEAWPLQPAYIAAYLDLSLRARDTRRVGRALALANRIGVALPASLSGGMDSLPEAWSLRELQNEQNRLRAPIVHSQTFRVLSDSTLFPEGVSVDVRNATMYVSSIYHRNVLVLTPDGQSRLLMRGSPANIGGIYGIVMDTLRGVLWAASAASPVKNATGDSAVAVASLLAIRLSDGQLVRRIAIPPEAANSSPGDITLAPNGDVLVADSQAGVLWWLRESADTLIGVRHRLFRSVQGAVVSADSKIVWVADYSHGLLRVELHTGAVQRVADLPGHTTLGIDGMVQYGGSLVAVQNGFAPMQVVRMTLDATGTRVVQHEVIDRNSAATSPTGGVVVNGQFIYIANSLWEMLDASGKFPRGVALPRPLLLSVPLKR